MVKHDPKLWEGNSACYGHDNEPAVQQLLAELGKRAQEYDVAWPVDPTISELFFPPRVRELYHVWADRAKDYCHGKDRRHPCPVRKQCLLWAIETDEEHGIFGGMSHRERNALVRKCEAEGLDVEQTVMEMEW